MIASGIEAGDHATQAQNHRSPDGYGEQGSGPMLHSIRKPTPGARRRAQAAPRMTWRRAINGDASRGQLSAAGQSRRHVRLEVIGRATATMIVASVVMAVASVPAAAA